MAVDTVRDSLAAHGTHYLQRVYTPRELEDCNSPQGVDPERLAARFAAKEATLKVLRPTDEGMPWSTIEVVRHPHGWVALELHGIAAKLAEQAGIEELSLSVSHEGGFASAVVVASCTSGSRATFR